MRLLFTALIFSFFHLSVGEAQNLSPELESSLSDHMVAVNDQWKDYEYNNVLVQFRDEDQRIQHHLAEVVKLLENADVTMLSVDQLANRKHTISILDKYRARGLFPKNDFLAKRSPIFKDNFNTSCAVAHLVEATGSQGLVEEIQQEANYAYLAELSEAYPQLGDWAYDNGFSIEELALIQPSYPAVRRDFYPWGSGGTVNGQVNVMVCDPEAELLYVAGRFSEIDGVAANNIIAWDGDAWVDMGTGVMGEIKDMAFNERSQTLVVAGDFYLENNSEMQNIAFWDGEGWHGLQMGDMEGAINTIYSEGAQLYLGGDFKKVNGEEMAYLTRGIYFGNEEIVDWYSSQSYNSNSGGAIGIENVFAVDGPVNVITKVEEKLLIGGSFTQTAPNTDTSAVQKLEVFNVAFWFQDWFSNGDYEFNEIHEAAYIDNRLYISDNIIDANGISSPRVNVLSAGFWNEQNYQCFDNTDVADQLISGFFYDETYAFAYGNIMIPDTLFAFVETAGFMQLNGGGQGTDRGINFNGLVRATAKFKNRMYFAGDFVHPSGPYDGLVSTSIVGGGTDAVIESDFDVDLDISCNDKVLSIEYTELKEELAFSLYNIEGKLIDTFNLTPGAAALQKDLSAYASGILIYQIHNGKEMVGGKVSVF